LYVPFATQHQEWKLNDSRTFLSNGPSAAKVDNVDYIKDIKDASGEEIEKVMGGKVGKFEVR
jgi:hypothetical protein